MNQLFLPAVRKRTVGYRFHPSDAEIVGHFLSRKNLGNANDDMPIAEIKVCDFEPWDLPDQSKIRSEDQAWYFFCSRDLKYSNSLRINRTTKSGSGYWKPTGKIRKVKAVGTRKVIGTKQSLVFYKKDHPQPSKTNWIMHEYKCVSQGQFVVCKLKTKSDGKISKNKHNEIASALVSPCQSIMTADSSCGECDPCDRKDPEVDYLKPDEMNAMSTYENGEQSCSMDFDFGNLEENEVTGSSCDENESSQHLTTDLEEQTSNDRIVGSSYHNGISLSKVKCYFKSQNSNNRTDILVSEEGDWSSHMAAPDFGMSIPSVGAGLAINELEASFLEVQGPPTFFDELKTLIEPEASIYSAQSHL